MPKVLSQREKIILYSTVGVIGFVLTFNLLIAPLLNRNAELNKEIEVNRAKLSKYLWLISQKEAIQAKYSKFSSTLKEGAKEDSLNLALSEIENIARESDIRLIDLRPEAVPKPSGPYKETAIELRAEGNAQSFLRFIYQLENSLSLFKIKRLQLSSRPASQLLEGRFNILHLLIRDTL